MPTNSTSTSASEDSGAVPPVNWRHFLTGADDATIGNVSALSKPAEWHALLVGVLTALGPGVAVAAGLPPTVATALGPGFAATYVAGRSTKDLARSLTSTETTRHIRDALAEPAYTTTGYLLGLGLAEVAAMAPV